MRYNEKKHDSSLFYYEVVNLIFVQTFTQNPYLNKLQSQRS